MRELRRVTRDEHGAMLSLILRKAPSGPDLLEVRQREYVRTVYGPPREEQGDEFLSALGVVLTCCSVVKRSTLTAIPHVHVCAGV